MPAVRKTFRCRACDQLHHGYLDRDENSQWRGQYLVNCAVVDRILFYTVSDAVAMP